MLRDKNYNCYNHEKVGDFIIFSTFISRGRKLAKYFKAVNIVKVLGFMILLLLVSNMIVSLVTKKAHFGEASGKIYELDKWTFTDAKGNSSIIEVPYAGSVPAGEKYRITCKVPDIKMGEDRYIFINSVQSDVEVWVGDEKRLSYLGKDLRIPLLNAPTRYLFVPVSEDDIGKDITIEYRSITRYNGKVFGVAIASQASVWMRELSRHGISFMLCIFGIVISICTFGTSFLAFSHVGGKSLRYISAGGLAICLWLLCEHRLNQLIFAEPLITGVMTYVFAIIMPIPMILYFNIIEGKRHEKLLATEAALILIEFVVMTILQFFTRFSYSVTLPVHYVIVGILIVTAFCIVLGDCKKPDRHIKTYFFSAIGMTVFAIASLVEILFLIFKDFYVVGMFIVPGVLLLVFLTSMQITKDTLEESEKKRKALEQSTINTIRIIAGAIDARDEYTGGHSSRVAYYASTLIKEMGYSEQDVSDMYYVGLLHDIGKIGIPDSILNKAGKLSNDEYHLMKFHSVIGAELLSKLDADERLIQGIRSHHERYDGKGYPDGLKGEEIPKIARALCLADSYDAMTSNRVYRNRLTPEQVEAEIMKNAGTQFDPELAKVFCNLISTGVISPSTYNGFEVSENGKLSKSAVIQRMIIQPTQFAGSKEVSRPEFMRMLMYILKIAEKNKTDTCVFLFTLKGHKGSALTQEETDRGMGILANAIARVFKSTDVVTQYSENQRVVAAIGSDNHDYRNLGNETLKEFNMMDSARKYDVDFRIVDWNSEAI